MLKHIRSETLYNFKRELDNALNDEQGFAEVARDCTKKSMRLFDEKCEDATSMLANRDYSKKRDKLSHSIDLHINEVRAAKLRDITTEHKNRFKEALCSQVEAQLKEANDNTWPAIKKLFDSETRTVVSGFSSALSSFEMNEYESGDMISKLKSYGRELVEVKAKQEAGSVKHLMKERFERIFCYGNDSKPRDWTENHDIPAIAETAHSSSLKLLSVLAAIRLDKHSTDNIWDTLKKGTTKSPRLLAPSTWEKVPAIKTLITPKECKSLWDSYKKDTDYFITQAISIRKGNKKNKKRKTWGVKVARIAVAHPKSVAGTVCAVGAVGVVLATTGGHVVVVVVVGAGAAGLVAGAVATGAIAGLVARNAMSYVKNSIWGTPHKQEEK